MVTWSHPITRPSVLAIAVFRLQCNPLDAILIPDPLQFKIHHIYTVLIWPQELYPMSIFLQDPELCFIRYPLIPFLLTMLSISSVFRHPAQHTMRKQILLSISPHLAPLHKWREGNGYLQLRLVWENAYFMVWGMRKSVRLRVYWQTCQRIGGSMWLAQRDSWQGNIGEDFSDTRWCGEIWWVFCLHNFLWDE